MSQTTASECPRQWVCVNQNWWRRLKSRPLCGSKKGDCEVDSVQIVREVLGWCTVLNTGLLIFSALLVILAGAPIKRLHVAMFDLSEENVSRAYFRYLAHYKLLIIVFNLVPYLALRIVA